MKIVFIIPYIGTFHNYFQLWLDSCKVNNNVDWLIFTDNTQKYDYPDNVKVIYKTFQDLKNMFQQKYDFIISLNHPYKFCDFKPAYGDIFSEYIRDYDFWGYCDLDLIWGNISKFITSDLLASYDKFFSYGHCTIFRNNQNINSIYKNKVEGALFYKDVFSSPINYAFDETIGLPLIFKNSSAKCYDTTFCFDVRFNIKHFVPAWGMKESFCQINPRYGIFKWNKGKVIYIYTSDGKRIEIKEYMYVHLQKRKMKICEHLDKDNYMIRPNRFINSKKITIKNLKKQSNVSFFYLDDFIAKIKWNLGELFGTNIIQYRQIGKSRKIRLYILKFIKRHDKKNV